MTFVRPSAAPASVAVAPTNRTQLLTSNVLQPVRRSLARAPAAPAEPPLQAIQTDPPDDDAPAPTWGIERKLFAVNMLLGLIVLFEFFVL